MPAERPDVRPTSREMSQRLGAEIATVREELDVLLAELDRRRHDPWTYVFSYDATPGGRR
jgi:hypothetical protein